MNERALLRISRSNAKRFSVPKLSEAQIERTCSDWMEAQGWRKLKTDPVSRKEWGKGFGEKGMADALYIRYRPKALTGLVCAAEILWCEWKSSTGRVKTHQLDWHRAERARGALTLIAGVDFEKSIEGFQMKYKELFG